jgi:hypothetical protein
MSDVSRRTNGGRVLVSLALAGVVTLALAERAAHAAGATSLRIGKGDGFERIVIDLPAGVRVERQTGKGDGFEVAVSGAKAPATSSELGRLGVRIDALGSSGFSLRSDRPPARVRAFLLQGPRLVIDLATGSAALPMPRDANPLPEVAHADAASEAVPPPESKLTRLDSLPSEARQSPEPAPAPAPPRAAPQAAQPPPRPGGSGTGPPIELRALILVGVDGSGVDIDELMKLELALASHGGVVDVASGPASSEPLRLADLARNRMTPLPITRGALDAVANQIAEVYTEKGLARPDVFVLPPPVMPNRRAKPDGRIVLVVKPATPAAAENPS